MRIKISCHANNIVQTFFENIKNNLLLIIVCFITRIHINQMYAKTFHAYKTVKN